jgi:hypothetical protein
MTKNPIQRIMNIAKCDEDKAMLIWENMIDRNPDVRMYRSKFFRSAVKVEMELLD